MKIVQIIHGFPPRNSAGSELYTCYLSRELAKRHDVSVFYRVSDPSREEYATASGEYDGLKTYTINNTFRNGDSFERTYKNDVIARKFGEFIDRIRPDIAHFGHVSNLSTTCVEEAARRGIPVVYTLHDYWLICQRGQLLKKDLSVCVDPGGAECVSCLAGQLSMNSRIRTATNLIRKRLSGLPGFASLELLLKRLYASYAGVAVSSGGARTENLVAERTEHIRQICGMVSMFISPSKFLKNKFVEFGIPDEKITHRPNGFNTDMFERVERKPSEHIRFGYVGTLIPSKGVHVLIDAFNRLSDKSSELRIYGMELPYEGYPSYARDLKKKAGNGRIRFMGPFENKRIGRILGEIDALVVPSVWFENSPSTIQEAFLAGVPVIASNMGGMAELVTHGADGLLFEPGDSTDLAEKMKLVSDDPGMLEELRANIGNVATIEENTFGVECIYDQLTKKRSSA